MLKKNLNLLGENLQVKKFNLDEKNIKFKKKICQFYIKKIINIQYSYIILSNHIIVYFLTI